MAEETTAGQGVTWPHLLRWTAVTALVEYAVVLVSAGEVIPPIVVIGLVIGIGLALSRRRAGVVVLLVGFVVFLASNLAFASRDLVEPRSFPGNAVAVAALLSGVIGIAAAVMALRHGRPSPTAGKLGVALAGSIVVWTIVNVATSVTYDDPKAGAGDVTLVAKDVKWSTATLSARAGDVTFFVDNRDLALHNLHIDGAGTISLPASHTTRETLRLAAGTYEYVCQLHPDDMKGTLTVT